jgi:hypothetical protein
MSGTDNREDTMSNFNNFRPSFDVLEGRALMSATLAAAQPHDPMPQTREHILLARQVCVPVAAGHEGTIEVPSWSLAPAAEATVLHRLFGDADGERIYVGN